MSCKYTIGCVEEFNYPTVQSLAGNTKLTLSLLNSLKLALCGTEEAVLSCIIKFKFK